MGCMLLDVGFGYGSKGKDPPFLKLRCNWVGTVVFAHESSEVEKPFSKLFPPLNLFQVCVWQLASP